MSAIEIAISAFRVFVVNGQERFYGVTLTDAYLPLLTLWDSERDLSMVVMFFGTEDERADAQRRVIAIVTEGYRHFEYPCGVVPAICGPDQRVIELDWEPSQADDEAYEMGSRLHDEGLKAHVDLMKAQGLWRLESEVLP